MAVQAFATDMMIEHDLRPAACVHCKALPVQVSPCAAAQLLRSIKDCQWHALPPCLQATFPSSIQQLQAFEQPQLPYHNCAILQQVARCAVQWDERERREVLFTILSRQLEIVQIIGDVQLELYR